MQVVEFNHDVLGIKDRRIKLQERSEAGLSYIQLLEEAEEFAEAYQKDDMVEAVDAVCDSIYFAYGILYKMGISEEKFNDIFSVIHNANMNKKLGTKKGREGYDAFDATKPEGWVAPEDQILEVLLK